MTTRNKAWIGVGVVIALAVLLFNPILDYLAKQTVVATYPAYCGDVATCSEYASGTLQYVSERVQDDALSKDCRDAHDDVVAMLTHKQYAEKRVGLCTAGGAVLNERMSIVIYTAPWLVDGSCKIAETEYC